MLELPEIKHYLSVLDMDVRDARMLLASSSLKNLGTKRSLKEGNGAPHLDTVNPYMVYKT